MTLALPLEPDALKGKKAPKSDGRRQDRAQHNKASKLRCRRPAYEVRASI